MTTSVITTFEYSKWTVCVLVNDTECRCVVVQEHSDPQRQGGQQGDKARRILWRLDVRRTLVMPSLPTRLTARQSLAAKA